MSRFLSILFIASLFHPVVQPAPANEKAHQRLFEVAPGSIIELRLFSLQKVQGRLSALRAEEFDLLYVKPDQLGTRTFRYDEVQSVRVMRDAAPASPARVAGNVLLVIGTLMGIGLVIGLINR